MLALVAKKEGEETPEAAVFDINDKDIQEAGYPCKFLCTGSVLRCQVFIMNEEQPIRVALAAVRMEWIKS